MNSRWSNWVIVLLAIAGIAVMVAIVASGERFYPLAAPVADPPRKPFAHVVSASGLVEASTANVAVGTPMSGVVARVFVAVGQRVETGTPLFALDGGQADAEIAARAATVEVARTRIAELRALEREAKEQLSRVLDLPDVRAVAREEVDRRKNAVVVVEARIQAAEAQWAQARAELAVAQTQRSRMTVRAPLSGEVLQVNIRSGEFAAAGSPQPLLVMGDTRTLHIRVDVDENDAWRIAPGATARAYVRGSNGVSTPARFVRFEPLVIPKRSLNGQSFERVDTRVLQVLFAFPRDSLPVYVGQQVDIMIEAKPADGAGPRAEDGNA